MIPRCLELILTFSIYHVRKSSSHLITSVGWAHRRGHCWATALSCLFYVGHSLVGSFPFMLATVPNSCPPFVFSSWIQSQQTESKRCCTIYQML
jgi:hypothetical protein